MINEEKTWNQLASREEALEVARLCQRLGVTVTYHGERCLVEVHDNKYGVLVCGKNKTKLSLTKYWGEVREQIRRELERVKRDVERALELVRMLSIADKDEDYVGRILSWENRAYRYLLIRPIPNLYKEEWLNKYVVIKIIDGVLAGTLIIARVIRYPTRNDYGIVFKLSRKLYKSIARHKREIVRFKILDVIDENQPVAH